MSKELMSILGKKNKKLNSVYWSEAVSLEVDRPSRSASLETFKTSNYFLHCYSLSVAPNVLIIS